MKTVLVANRGEIAVRVIRACHDLGLEAVAVFSDCDRAAPHVSAADRAFALGGDAPGDTYLRIDKLLEVAERAGADAVHPGYGFLAENEDFSAACRDREITFIGPSPEAIALMGSKTAAREVAKRSGAPLVPGTDGPLAEASSDAEVLVAGEAIGYPLLVKAVAGGGGKGMRTVNEPAGLLNAVRAARSEANSAFGDSAVYFERQIVRPRHIEVQLLADTHGTVIPFVERECSIQRRHQKVVEESPSTVVSDTLRRRMAESARSIAAAVGYTNAGTIEFLVDASGHYYFLEMNTRLQVEHPVTELVTGLDLVTWQIRIARGERLTIDPEQALTPRGHAIECRVYAEDPDQKFMPTPGKITRWRPPLGPGVRDDSGAASGFEVPIYYDSMISKLVVWGADRVEAMARMRRAVREYDIQGVTTTLGFFRWLLDQAAFVSANFDTMYLDRVLAERHGRTFAAASDHDERLAVMFAAVVAYARASGTANGQAAPAPETSRWLRVARREMRR